MDPQDRFAHGFGSAFNLFGETVAPPAEPMFLRQSRQRQGIFVNHQVPRRSDYFQGGHSHYENRAGVNLDFFGDLGPQTVPVGEPGHQYQPVCSEPRRDPDQQYEAICPELDRQPDHQYEVVCPEPGRQPDHQYKAVCAEPGRRTDHHHETFCPEPGRGTGHQYEAVFPEPGREPDHQYGKACPTSRDVEVSDVHSAVGNPRRNELSDLNGSSPESEPGDECGSEAEEVREQDNECQGGHGASQGADREFFQQVNMQGQRNRSISSLDGPELPHGLQSLQIDVVHETPSENAIDDHDQVPSVESESQSVNLGREVSDDPQNDGDIEIHEALPIVESVSPQKNASGHLTWKSSLIGMFTVQCARCFKWRLVPNREMYESIREHVLESPWFCEKALQWRREAHCGLPTDLIQSAQTLWAMDKPNLPAAPLGWQRKIVIRRDTSSRFADVYYTSPTGKVLRSMPDVAKYLVERELSGQVFHDVGLEKFSFTAPRPLPGVWTPRSRKRNAATAGSTTEEDPSKKARLLMATAICGPTAFAKPHPSP